MTNFDLTNAVLIHIDEQGDFEIMSSSDARILLIDERNGESVHVCTKDSSADIAEFIGADDPRMWPTMFNGDFVDDEPDGNVISLVR